MLALMSRHANTYIEFSSFQIHYGPEFLAAKFGAERLLLGTEWPFKSPGAARVASSTTASSRTRTRPS